MKRLLIIIPDRLSELIKKGEITPRYYNPCNLFDEVDICLTNDDKPDRDILQKTVGTAKLSLHNLPASMKLFARTLGFQLPLLKPWLGKCLGVIKEIAPDVIRVHNNFVEGALAYYAKKAFGIPYVVSLHGVWNKDKVFDNELHDRIFKLFVRKFEGRVLRGSEAVICVYKPIIPYARLRGATSCFLVYNYVSERIPRKESYSLGEIPTFVTINRQVPEKNPENIIRAVVDIECKYVVIGDGVYHDYLKGIVDHLGLGEKVVFIKALDNEVLIQMLPKFDFMVSHCEYWGISKGILEGSLAGLPIVVNKHPLSPIPDYEGGWLLECENSIRGYRNAILALIGDQSFREKLGTSAHIHAKECWDPQKMEEKVCRIYENILSHKVRLGKSSWA